MHIKQITIFNFRSFEQQPEITPFSPGTNSVVGRNGSGKSNLFDAVQFVLLSPRFLTLRQEERQALLHEGAGSAAVNAFVEVVFDNSDGRFSLESDEVVLRRTIGPKKDEFFLQRKRATKQEISSLLEGAGFSKSNPYFMIQQGKIQDICTMRDNERLALLKSVAGTTVYDEKKQESLAKMEENESSREKIAELLDDIEQRLEELHGEKEDLTNYQQLDRKRRAIEYTLYDKELRRARKQLDNLERERMDHYNKLSELHELAKQTHDSIRNVEAVIKTKASILQRNKKNLKNLEADKSLAVKEVTKLKLQCRELEESIKAKENQEQSNQKDLAKLKQEIEKAQAQLDKIKPQHEEATRLLQQMTHDRDQKRHEAEALHDKLGRGSHFQTKAERDKFLQSKIQEHNDNKAEKEGILADCQASLSSLRRAIAQETEALAESSKLIATKKEQQQTFVKGLDAKKKQRVQVLEKRQNQQRETEDLNEKLRDAREAMNRAISDARKVMPRNTAYGLESLEKVVREENLIIGEHYFGMLMENITLKDHKYQTAVEAAAQNALFHVVVDSDSTAARLMKRLEDGKLGRVTFLPLNRLRVERVTYPNVPDVKPMMDFVDCDPKVMRAVEHVFHKKLLARNIDLATEWSKKCDMDAVTMDGDQANRKGALTGGYIDSSKSRLTAHKNKVEAAEALRKAQADFDKGRQERQEIEQEAANVAQEMERLEGKNKEMQRQIRDMERDHEKVKKKIDKNKKEVEKLEGKVPPLELEIAGLETDIKRLQDEMKTELTSTLSAEEKQRLATLKDEEKKLTDKIDKQTDIVYKLGGDRQRLQSLLEDNLMKRQEELQGLAPTANEEEDDVFGGKATFAAKIAREKEDLEDKNEELGVATRQLERVDAQIEEARKACDDINAQLATASTEHEQLKNEDLKIAKQLEEAQEESEKMLSKRTNYVANRESYATKIQELGALPPPAEREPYAGKKIDQLMKALESCNKSIKKYSHVNKKAYDQYVNFSEQRDSLMKRKTELDRSADKVQELIESLDRQKDEAINRTFRGVSAHFKEVFKELVPLGEGQLVMRTALDEGDSDNEDEDPSSPEPKKKKALDPKNPEVSLYRGVSVKVRFSPVGENFMMSQLSGGQKALVALALIFAIQRCDPAPFYIFDELDQALDSTYRASVASLIQKQANSAENPTQFIVSTFRPELVAVADQCYGISHQSKVSRFHEMTKKDALAFIANLMTEEENVGEVTTAATRRASNSRKRKASASAANEEPVATEG